MPLPLRKLGGAFGLHDDPNSAKGFFPLKYLTPKFEDAIVPFPSLKEFGIDDLSGHDAEQLQQWHRAERVQSNGWFDVKENLLRYPLL